MVITWFIVVFLGIWLLVVLLRATGGWDVMPNFVLRHLWYRPPPPDLFVCNELWDISVDKMAALMWTFDNVFTKITTSNNKDLWPLKTDDVYQKKRKYIKN